jgi:hypothetical protein
MRRTIIKKVLKEEVDKIKIEDLIKKYHFKGGLLSDYFNKLQDGISLSDIEIHLAKLKLVELGILNKMKKDITKYIFGNEHLQSLTKKFGIAVYKNLTIGNKKSILDTIYSESSYRLGQPSQEWFDNNIEDLEELKDRFPNLEVRANKEISKCEKKEFYGITENEGKYFIWSILNKIDTNYVNWAKFISDRVDNGDLRLDTEYVTDISESEFLIGQYFFERDINNINIDLELLEIIKSSGVSRISYGELDIVESFYTYLNKANPTKFENMLSTIQSTTSQGDNVELNFIKYINDFGSKFVNNIRSFSTPGNLVDMGFGIDMIVNLFGKDYAIQVKSNEKHARKAKIQYLPLNYLILFPKDEQYPDQFLYLSNSQKTPADFNKKMNEIIEKKSINQTNPDLRIEPPTSQDYLKYSGDQ